MTSPGHRARSHGRRWGLCSLIHTFPPQALRMDRVVFAGVGQPGCGGVRPVPQATRCPAVTGKTDEGHLPLSAESHHAEGSGGSTGRGGQAPGASFVAVGKPTPHRCPAASAPRLRQGGLEFRARACRPAPPGHRRSSHWEVLRPPGAHETQRTDIEGRGAREAGPRESVGVAIFYSAAPPPPVSPPPPFECVSPAVRVGVPHTRRATFGKSRAQPSASKAGTRRPVLSNLARAALRPS